MYKIARKVIVVSSGLQNLRANKPTVGRRCIVNVTYFEKPEYRYSGCTLSFALQPLPQQSLAAAVDKTAVVYQAGLNMLGLCKLFELLMKRNLPACIITFS
jgi:hypothetical protein